MDGLCATNVISDDGTIDQYILVNYVFHLCGRGPSKVLLKVSIFFCSFNFSLLKRSLLLETVLRKES